MAELTASPRRSASEAHGAVPALTEQFRAAVRPAQEIHGHQRRPGTETPYLAHLLVVTGLVLEDRGDGDEDQAIAAMLHHSVEDGGGRPMLERTARRWIERKRRYLRHLATVDDDAILRVALADKVHNARSIVRDCRREGHALCACRPRRLIVERIRWCR